MAESGVALGVANPKVSKMRESARRRHRTPARYSFQPVIAAKSLSRASCSQIKAQQEVLYSRKYSGARAEIGVRVETAGLRKLCLPASHEPTGMYPVSYVQGLEQRVAGLQGRLDQQSAKSMTQELPESGSPLAPNLQTNIHPDLQGFTGHLDAFYMPSVPSQGNSFDLSTFQADNLFSISQQPPADEANYSTDTTRSLDPSMAAVVTDISVREGASFFQTYFEIIHPRYPFLDVEECSTAYIKWKAGEIATCGNNAWSTCLLKLVMLLHAFHELHGESTERVVHIVGVAMRFAIFNGFHRLTNDGTYEIEMKIKAWWCIYWYA
uniref:Transcription factor domain-containing protein n=1 Tax=Fusarium oxysporum (strain Fo5176) TaxID=660025 RepID=A0A0D2YER4_FUSOF